MEHSKRRTTPPNICERSGSVALCEVIEASADAGTPVPVSCERVE